MNLIEGLKFIWTNFGILAILFFTDLSLWPQARYLLPKIKSRTVASIYHIVTGLVFCAVLFEKQLFLAIGMVVTIWLTLGLPIYISIPVACAWNTIVHLYLIIFMGGQWKFEISCITMIVFHKALGTIFNLYHGKKLAKGEKIKRKFHEDMALKERPSFLDWCAFCFTPFGGNSGPAIEFKLFEFILEAGNREHIKDDSKDRSLARGRWIESIVMALINLFFMPYCKFSVYTSEWFSNLPIFVKPFMTLLITLGNITRYLCAWLNVDAAYYELGLGSCGIATYDDVTNGTIPKLLTSKTVGRWIQDWNHSAHLFWKKYLFYPLLDAGVPYVIAHNAVFAASALWHGFHPVFYMVLPEMLMATNADLIFDRQFPITDETPFWKTIPRRFWTITTMLNAISPWWYRSASAVITIKRANHWILPIYEFVVWSLATVYDKLHPVKRQKKAPAEKPKAE